ncbi:MAG TPA: c-type cytochrome domain-containing protein, partial [Chryseosolibacter sp.]|nr:c-type cytochrome domain-containing protein [Chryseosolibacter sp.]
MWCFLQKIFVLLSIIGLLQACTREKIDFSTQVKPILNKRCISCHGGVKQNGGFSVLFREEAVDTLESGKHAIVPGDVAHSEMIRRINERDPELRMPYKEEPLTREEINILTKWIEQGAEWGEHWAYNP